MNTVKLPLDSASHGSFVIRGDLQGVLSLRAAGDMREPATRATLLDALGLHKPVACVQQVHSRRVVTAVAALRGAVDADGLMTDRPDESLLVTVADCLPIYLASETGASALVHSGWRGTGIVLQAVRMLAQRCGAAVSSITAVIGPGIGPCCYHVDRARAELFRSRYGNEAVISERGRPHLDLRRVNEMLLAGAGVVDVRSIDLCTSCTPELWSSRRDGGGSSCSLMAAVLRRTPL